MVPLINGVEYSFADISAIIGTSEIIGFTAIEYEEKQEKKNIQASGRRPTARSYGKIEATCKMTVLQSTADAIAGNVATKNLIDVAPFDITIVYLNNSGVMQKDVIRNCEFMNNKRGGKEGDMNMPVELELICSHVEWSV